MKGYELLKQFEQLTEKEQYDCVSYLLGGVSMIYEGFEDSTSRPDYPSAKFVLEEFEKSLTYVKEKQMSKPILDQDYPVRCQECKVARVHKRNELPVCVDCYRREKGDYYRKIYEDWRHDESIERYQPKNKGQVMKGEESKEEQQVWNGPKEQPKMVHFETGAIRGSEELPFHLITPHGLLGLATKYGEGAIKYSPYNCLKGLPLSNLYNHAILHLLRFWWSQGDSEDNLSAALWNINQMIYQVEKGEHQHLDDRPAQQLHPDDIAEFIGRMNEAISKIKQ